MKTRSTQIALLLTVVLAVFLLMLACGTSPQNTTQNQNQNQNQNQSQLQAAASPIIHDPACNETDIEVRRQKTQEKIDRELKEDDELKDGRVKILVRVVNAIYLEALVEGRAAGDRELEDLNRILRKFMKEKCVLKVSFVPPGTIGGATAVLLEGFEWGACEHPKVACPDGECANPPCIGLSPVPTGSPSNANTNSNSNVRRGNP